MYSNFSELVRAGLLWSTLQPNRFEYTYLAAQVFESTDFWFTVLVDNGLIAFHELTISCLYPTCHRRVPSWAITTPGTTLERGPEARDESFQKRLPQAWRDRPMDIGLVLISLTAVLFLGLLVFSFSVSV